MASPAASTSRPAPAMVLQPVRPIAASASNMMLRSLNERVFMTSTPFECWKGWYNRPDTATASRAGLAADCHCAGIDVAHAADVARNFHGKIALGCNGRRASQMDMAVLGAHDDVQAVDIARVHQCRFHLGGDPAVVGRLCCTIQRRGPHRRVSYDRQLV